MKEYSGYHRWRESEKIPDPEHKRWPQQNIREHEFAYKLRFSIPLIISIKFDQPNCMRLSSEHTHSEAQSGTGILFPFSRFKFLIV